MGRSSEPAANYSELCVHISKNKKGRNKLFKAGFQFHHPAAVMMIYIAALADTSYQIATQLPEPTEATAARIICFNDKLNVLLFFAPRSVLWQAALSKQLSLFCASIHDFIITICENDEGRE